MIFLFNANGDRIDFITDNVYRGSNKANSVYFMCPVSKNCVVSAVFSLPDNTTTVPYLMERVSSDDISGVYSESGEQFNIWKKDVPKDITYQSGNVSVQFTVATSGGTVVTTASSTFFIEEGVYSPSVEDIENYSDILTALQGLQEYIETFEDDIEEIENSKADKVTNPTENSLCYFDGQGKVADSGISKNSVVKTESAQTISGVKTYTDKAVFSNAVIQLANQLRKISIGLRTNDIGKGQTDSFLYLPDGTGYLAKELTVKNYNTGKIFLEDNAWIRLGTKQVLTIGEHFSATVDPSVFESSSIGGVDGEYQLYYVEYEGTTAVNAWKYSGQVVDPATFGVTVTLDSDYSARIKHNDSIYVKRETVNGVTTISVRTAVYYKEQFACALTFKTGNTFSIDYSALNISWSGEDVSRGVFVPVPNKVYDIYFYNNSNNDYWPRMQATVRGV